MRRQLSAHNPLDILPVCPEAERIFRRRLFRQAVSIPVQRQQKLHRPAEMGPAFPEKGQIPVPVEIPGNAQAEVLVDIHICLPLIFRQDCGGKFSVLPLPEAGFPKHGLFQLWPEGQVYKACPKGIPLVQLMVSHGDHPPGDVAFRQHHRGLAVPAGIAQDLFIPHLGKGEDPLLHLLLQMRELLPQPAAERPGALSVDAKTVLLGKIPQHGLHPPFSLHAKAGFHRKQAGTAAGPQPSHLAAG